MNDTTVLPRNKKKGAGFGGGKADVGVRSGALRVFRASALRNQKASLSFNVCLGRRSLISLPLSTPTVRGRPTG